jgi:hypothetical protein
MFKRTEIAAPEMPGKLPGAATWAVLLVGILLLGVFAWLYLPEGIDWEQGYREGALNVLTGHEPYGAQDGFYAPPWSALMLAPFAVLPVDIGRSALFVAAVLSYGFAAWRCGAGRLSFALFLGSPVVLHGLLNCNMDWLVLWAIALPPRWGLFFALVKPQVGIGLCVWWLAEAWRDGGWRRVVEVFWPITVVGLLSLAIYGLWPLASQRITHLYWNVSLWPYAIPLGIALMAIAIKKRAMKPALAASPFFSPYMMFHSYAGAVVTLAGNTKAMIAAFVLLWGLVLLAAVI